MGLMIQTCLGNFHDTVAPPSIKIYLLVDFESLMLEIQLASLYPSSIIK